MQNSDIPYRFAEVFAAGAAGSFITDPIPQTATGPVASQHLGFPPETALPEEAGGTPPNIADFNGIAFYATAWARWLQAGAPIPWSSAFSTAIGGYPKGAVVASASVAGRMWASTTENNTTNPDASGAGWVQFPIHGQTEVLTPGLGNFAVPELVNLVYVEVWGGGGGAVGGAGGSGGGGGYAAKWLRVTPGGSVAYTVGAAGSGTGSGGTATAGGTSACDSLSATGGGGGATGEGGQGVGSGGTTNRTGQSGIDIDGGVSFVVGQVWTAVGGNSPFGGFGGNLNAVGSGTNPTAPGGGGGCNYAVSVGQNGAAGGIRFTW